MKKFFVFIFACFFIFSTITAAHAHPADVYAHAIRITLSRSNLNIKWEIKPGPMLTSYLWAQADADQNGILSTIESESWARDRAALLIATLNDQPLPLLIESVQMPASLQNFQAGEEFITLILSAELPAESTSPQQLTLTNQMEQKTSINWFYVSATEDSAFLPPIQKNNTLTVDIVQDHALTTNQNAFITSWDSGRPSLPKDAVTQTAEQVVPALAKNSAQEILLGLIHTEDFSISFYLFALGISFALGALHALTPGHGKTVVAAYLVGSRGTTKHAIALGSIVTLTHTGSVFIIGLVTLAASRYILPTSLLPILEVLSGLLIVGLGFYLLWQRILVLKAKRFNARSTNEKKEKGFKNISLAPSASFVLKKRPQKNNHHHGDGKMHSHDMPETITWRSLVALGISGGLVPCPDAIAILLVAIAINRILLGLALIISFSFGLAVVLIVIGLLMVNGSRLFTRIDAFNKFAPLMPIISAGVVLILGFTLTYGAISKLESFPSITGSDSNLNSEAQVIYINTDENKVKQLFMVDAQGNHPIKLTETSNGVVDYAISPDEKQIVFTEQTQDIEYNLWLLNLNDKTSHLAVACNTAICGQPIWSPDGKRIIYENMLLNDGVSSLWWFDVDENKTQPVFQEARLPGTNPRWSPDGKWLSYATPEGIKLIELNGEESRLIINTLGAAVEWAPDSRSFLLRDVIIQQNRFVTQLFLYDLSSQKITNLNANPNMENILAAWSPDGKSIAVVRRDLNIPRGDQVWIMQADGSQARVLTNTPAVLHGSLNWQADGNFILYDLYLLDSFPLESQLEMVNVNNGKLVNLKILGYNPKWIKP